jgi:hypothetical protein
MCEYFLGVIFVFTDYYKYIMKYVYKYFVKDTKALIHKVKIC